MPHIKITSDGISNNTEVSVGDKRVDGVTKIVIDPIAPDGFVTATISFELCSLDVELGDFKVGVDDVFINDKIKSALLSE